VATLYKASLAKAAAAFAVGRPTEACFRWKK
jgi:hypothetical protein